MQADFPGTLYLDHQAPGLEARVVLTPSALEISYTSPAEKVPVRLYWQQHRLQYTGTGQQTRVWTTAHPEQILVVTAPAFQAALTAWSQPAPPARPMTNPPPRGLAGPLLVLAVLLALVPLAYFWLLPALADWAARRVPPGYERRLGEQVFRATVSHSSVDQEKTRQLRGFVRQLRFSGVHPVRVTVVKNQEPNAFALPGGYIVVHDGMLTVIESPGELAALLSHEYGHVRGRHTTRALFRAAAGYALVSFLVGDLGGLTAVLLENAQSLRSLQYSRELEREADDIGLALLVENKINPEEMVRLFRHLQQQERVSAPAFLSTHPALTERMARIKDRRRELRPPHQINDSLNYYWRQVHPRPAAGN